MIDIATGTEGMLVDSKKLAGRPISEEDNMRWKRLRLARTHGIVSYAWIPNGCALLVPADGDLLLPPFSGEPRGSTGINATISGLLDTREIN